MSLDPPLILWSIRDAARSADVFLAARSFNLSVLACDQQALASLQDKIKGELANGIADDAYTKSLPAATRTTLKSIGKLSPTECGGASVDEDAACRSQFRDAPLRYVIAGAPLLGLGVVRAMTQLLAQAALAIGEPLRLRVQVQSFEAVCKLVQAGMGIGVLPEAAAQNFGPVMELRLVRLTDSWAQRGMFVCVRDLASLTTIGRKLVEQLVGADSLRKMRNPG